MTNRRSRASRSRPPTPTTSICATPRPAAVHWCCSAMAGPRAGIAWRHQLQAVSAAGFRAVAPDMRGYGGTQAPEPIDQYTLYHLVGDMAELVKALGETKAVIVGHDWGAPVAWHAALWRPDLFTAVCAMSVPYAPPGYIDVLSALEKLRHQRLLPAVLPEARRARGRTAAGHSAARCGVSTTRPGAR